MAKENSKPESIKIDVGEEVAGLINHREEFFISIAGSLRHIYEDMGKLKDIDNKIIMALAKKEKI